MGHSRSCWDSRVAKRYCISNSIRRSSSSLLIIIFAQTTARCLRPGLCLSLRLDVWPRCTVVRAGRLPMRHGREGVGFPDPVCYGGLDLVPVHDPDGVNQLGFRCEVDAAHLPYLYLATFNLAEFQN